MVKLSTRRKRAAHDWVDVELEGGDGREFFLYMYVAESTDDGGRDEMERRPSSLEHL